MLYHLWSLRYAPDNIFKVTAKKVKVKFQNDIDVAHLHIAKNSDTKYHHPTLNSY